MNCKCHGQPANWQRDTRMKAGGWWVCAVKRREYGRRGYWDKYREAKLAQARERYANGGDLIKRRRDLKRLRTRTLEQLAELEQEGKPFESQP